MTKSEFDAFVQKQQAEADNVAGFDPKQQLQEWLDYIDLLYKKINDYMDRYIAANTASITYNDITLTEDFSGSYSIRRMLLKIGRSTVTFTPIGTMLIGSKGRVDVQGPRGGARLILINKKVSHARQLISVRVSRPGDPPPRLPTVEDIREIEWEWKIITPSPEMGFVELTDETFFNMILTVANS
jgi:hypothetical protein